MIYKTYWRETAREKCERWVKACSPTRLAILGVPRNMWPERPAPLFPPDVLRRRGGKWGG